MRGRAVEPTPRSLQTSKPSYVCTVLGHLNARIPLQDEFFGHIDVLVCSGCVELHIGAVLVLSPAGSFPQ